MYASTESDREFARNAGMDDPDRAWILAPSDAWYPNPFYSGPPVNHPEDDSDYGPEEFGPWLPRQDYIPY
mgnify:CR=1 FL=1